MNHLNILAMCLAHGANEVVYSISPFLSVLENNNFMKFKISYLIANAGNTQGLNIFDSALNLVRMLLVRDKESQGKGSISIN